MILVIDNYDSFVYNLVQILGVLHQDIKTVRNDELTVKKAVRLGPAAIVVSPGPGIPAKSGRTCDIIAHFAGRIPILGVCLGHQAIAEVFGGMVVRAPLVVHGKVSEIHHDGLNVYRGIACPFKAARYHSLIVDAGSVPDCLKITARTADGLVMGIRHLGHPVEGIQFHPESFLTKQGELILKNFVGMLES